MGKQQEPPDSKFPQRWPPGAIALFATIVGLAASYFDKSIFPLVLVVPVALLIEVVELLKRHKAKNGD